MSESNTEQSTVSLKESVHAAIKDSTKSMLKKASSDIPWSKMEDIHKETGDSIYITIKRLEGFLKSDKVIDLLIEDDAVETYAESIKTDLDELAERFLKIKTDFDKLNLDPMTCIRLDEVPTFIGFAERYKCIVAEAGALVVKHVDPITALNEETTNEQPITKEV